ncbi:MAG: hypothetical protein L3J39_18280 [Verrucomicrobiales bacterium]|nr:hypothetical protein [Verrucomicrobiales bacterium]
MKKAPFGLVEVRPWMALVDERCLVATVGLRGDTAVEIGRDANHPSCRWLRGPEISPCVLALPFEQLYQVDESESKLIPLGASLPVRSVPDIEWETLSIALIPGKLPSKLPITSIQGVAVTRVRARELVDANLIRVSAEAWCDFANAAADIRLKPLSFAASIEGDVIVRGSPLPSITGNRLVEINGIVTDLGYTWSPAIATDILRKYLNLVGKDLAILLPNTCWEKIEAANFISATRSAARQTKELLAALK